MELPDRICLKPMAVGGSSLHDPIAHLLRAGRGESLPLGDSPRERAMVRRDGAAPHALARGSLRSVQRQSTNLCDRFADDTASGDLSLPIRSPQVHCPRARSVRTICPHQATGAATIFSDTRPDSSGPTARTRTGTSRRSPSRSARRGGLPWQRWTRTVSRGPTAMPAMTSWAGGQSGACIRPWRGRATATLQLPVPRSVTGGQFVPGASVHSLKPVVVGVNRTFTRTKAGGLKQYEAF